MEQNFQEFLKNRTLSTQATNKADNTKSFEELVIKFIKHLPS